MTENWVKSQGNKTQFESAGRGVQVIRSLSCQGATVSYFRFTTYFSSPNNFNDLLIALFDYY